MWTHYLLTLVVLVDDVINPYFDPWKMCHFILFFIFFYQGFRHRHWQFTGQQGKGGDHLLFHSTTSNRSHWHIYLQLCMWDAYHIFLITTLVFTRLLLDEIYHLIELPFKWLIDDAMFVSLLDELILGFVTAIWYWKPVDLNLHRLSPLYYKRTD